jgi:hypothetical protein
MTIPDGRSALGGLWNSIQTWLFPMLEDEIGELDEKHRQFVAVCELCAPQDYMGAYRWIGNGCPPSDRLALCKAFIAKAVWDFATTRDLIDGVRHRPALRRLCGWESLADVPSEATFSRAFDAFAQDVLPQRIHEALIKTHYADKLAGHVSRDATAIDAREKAAHKPQKEAQSPKKRGRRPKGQPPSPPPDPSRLERQLERGLAENLADLPTACDWGCKKNSQSKVENWRGYKLHVDTIDGDIPVSAILSSASLHDSQVARSTAGRCSRGRSSRSPPGAYRPSSPPCAALGVVTVVFGLGQVLGPVAGGALADALQSNAPAFTMAGAVALVLGIGGSMFLPRGSQEIGRGERYPP